MKTVLIFEDDLVIQQGINQIVIRAFFEAGRQVNLFNCATLEDAYRYISGHKVDLFLLDVAIPGNPRAGIELGIEVVSTERYRKTPIIYITANPNTVFEAVNKTHCFQFLEKPFSENDLLQALNKVIHESSPPGSPAVVLESMGKEYTFRKDEILYLESMGHNVTVWLLNDVVLLKNVTMHALLEKLSHPFIQCHKSFAVNTEHIKIMDKPDNTIYTDNGKSVPIGRAYKKLL